MNMKLCPICTRPDAAVILDALKRSKMAASKVSGVPRTTIILWVKIHGSMPPHEVKDLSVIRSSLFIVDPQTASPEVLQRAILTKLLLLSEKACGIQDQVKVTALKAAADIANDLQKRQDRLREREADDGEDSNVPAESSDPLPPWLQAPQH